MHEHRWAPQRRHGWFTRWRAGRILPALHAPSAVKRDDRRPG